MKLDYVIGTVKILYKNMWYKRPKGGVFMLVFMTLFTSANAYISTPEKELALFTSVISLILWFIGVPIVIYLMDSKTRPERIDHLIRTTSNFYSFKISSK